MFNQAEVQDLLKIVDAQYTSMIMFSLGSNVLSNEDIILLQSHGINPYKAVGDYPPYLQMYYLGRLAATLKDNDMLGLSFNNFSNYLKKQQFVPLSTREKKSYEIAQQNTYNYLKGLNNRVKSDITNIITEQNKKDIIKTEILTSAEKRKSIQQTISEIGHKTGDWNHDWKRIVATEMNNIFLQGKIGVLLDRYGKDHKVYKQVFEQACRHCIKLHLTNGLGSKPILFTLEQLINNGSNIGKKVDDWKATTESVHPYCRCFIISVLPRQEWNDKTQKFEYPKDQELIRQSKIKVTIDDKVFYI